MDEIKPALYDLINSDIKPDNLSWQDMLIERSCFYRIEKGEYHVFITHCPSFKELEVDEAICSVYKNKEMELNTFGSVDEIMKCIKVTIYE